MNSDHNHGMSAPRIGLAFAAALVLTACGGADAPDPLAPGGEEAPVDEPGADNVGADSDAQNGDAEAGGAVEGSFVRIDGDEFAVESVQCRAADIPDWWSIDASLIGEGEGRYYLQMGGNITAEGTIEENLIEVQVPPRPETEAERPSDTYISTADSWFDGMDYQLDENGASGTVELERRSYPVIGSAMPDGLDRAVEFSVTCTE